MKKIIMFMFVMILLTGLTAQAGDPIVIANKNVPVSSLTRAEAQNIFLGKNVMWPGGKKISIAVLKEGAVHESFLKDVLAKNASQFDITWKQAIFTGKGRPPKTVGTEAEMVQFVSSTDGAVGYIGSDTPHANAKKIELK